MKISLLCGTSILSPGQRSRCEPGHNFRLSQAGLLSFCPPERTGTEPDKQEGEKNCSGKSGRPDLAGDVFMIFTLRREAADNSYGKENKASYFKPENVKDATECRRRSLCTRK